MLSDEVDTDAGLVQGRRTSAVIELGGVAAAGERPWQVRWGEQSDSHSWTQYPILDGGIYGNCTQDTCRIDVDDSKVERVNFFTF